MVEAGIEVSGVVTKADRPAGRGMRLAPRPVADRARELGMPLYQPERPRGEEARSWLGSQRADAAVVVAYGSILPKELIEVPPLGFVNLHFSLLPRYRGAAPVARAIMDGVAETGVSTMVLTEGMDEGPVLARRPLPVSPDETMGSVGKRLAEVGAGLLIESLRAYSEGELKPEPQDHAQATYAPKITDEEARIAWGARRRLIRDLTRALNPAPGAWTTLRGTRLKVHGAHIRSESKKLPAGELLAAAELWVGTGDGALALTEVQLAGRRRMSGAELARGLRLEPGETLE
ncbi:MAG: methionyl-tRNA formyltransferase [Actinomycetota bacterium]|nr:methionyl-tRNA formyltransferase [Actinomycetota bacterium]